MCFYPKSLTFTINSNNYIDNYSHNRYITKFVDYLPSSNWFPWIISLLDNVVLITAKYLIIAIDDTRILVNWFYVTNPKEKNVLLVLLFTSKIIRWNPDFLNPKFFEPPDNSNPKSFPSLQANTVILPQISRTTRFFFEPIFISLAGLKNKDCTIYYCLLVFSRPP